MSLACAGMLFACNNDTTPAESGSAAPTSSVKASGSTTKVSSSAAKKIKVTFNYNYQGAPDATVKTAGADGKVTLPGNPEKEDAEFKEWNTKADGTGTKVTADNVWEADATVYAIWIEAYGAPTARAGKLDAAPYETPSAYASSTDASKGLTKITWSALDIIEAESAKFDKAADSIRFNGPVHKDENADDEGSHLVYEIYSPKAIAKANLYITATWHTQTATYWAKEENDTAKGYEKNADGEWYRPDYRWGIKVNGTVAELNEAEHKSPESGEVSTQMMPTEFALKEGINKIDLYTYGGYRAKMSAMKIVGK
jgi:hypothetical protein